jgi:hypothetical protein
VKIVTQLDPDAPSSSRWRAYDDETYDADCGLDGYFSMSPVGRGPTKEEAIKDLLLQTNP